MQILKKFYSDFISLLGFASATLAIISLFNATTLQVAMAKKPSEQRHSLLIFAPDMLSKALAKQLAAFSGREDDLEIREISLVYVVGRSASAQLGSNVVAPAVKLRAHYKVGIDEFRTILTDGNGEIELVSDAPVTATQLFETTDAVPTTHEAQR